MSRTHIETLLDKLPNSPGVYKLKNDEGLILYVGKAKNLNKRVRSYFRKQKGRAKRTEKLVEATTDIEWIEVGSDMEAIFLETNLIKEYRPKYNVLMKDDKNFVYIKITKNEDYPRIKIVRRVDRDGARYFGPKTAAGKVKKTLLLLQKLFKYRSCDLGIDWKGERDNEKDSVDITKKTIAFPCLDFHIKRCAAPCIGKISPEEYAKSIEQIEHFLEGKTKPIVNSLKEQIKKCIDSKSFEKAAILRDKLLAIESLEGKTLVTNAHLESHDVVAFKIDSGKAFINLFQVREGKLINQENFIVDALGFLEGEEDHAPEVLEAFLYQYYLKSSDIPPRVLVPIEIEEAEFFEDWLSNQVDRRIHLKVPQRGEKNELIKLAKKNAESFMRQHKARWAGFEMEDGASLESLKKHLDLKKIPKRIECFDISHLNGEDTVASMVVFKGGKSSKSDYRKFKVSTLPEGQIDDFASMNEVLNRRLLYLSYSPPGIKFRKARASDLKHIAALRLEWDGDDEMRGDIEDYHLAFKDKVPVAMLWSIEGSHSTFLLKGLFVSEEFRGQKIATGLIRYVVAKRKAKRAYLCARGELLSFYKKRGFEVLKSFPKKFEDHLSKLKELYPDEEIFQLAYDPVKQKDYSFSEKPDLIVIDGGKGQLSSALKARDALGLKTPMIGLAKRFEDVYVEGKSLPVLIPKNDPALKVLQQLRDEAHRFAITFQRKSRKKYLTESKLDHVKGLGDVGKMKLLQKFGSLANIKKASDEEIVAVVGESLLKKIRSEL